MTQFCSWDSPNLQPLVSMCAPAFGRGCLPRHEAEHAHLAGCLVMPRKTFETAINGLPLAAGKRLDMALRI